MTNCMSLFAILQKAPKTNFETHKMECLVPY